MIVCADDFGIADDVDQSIVTLAGEGKISAVSVMVALLPAPTPALRALLQHRVTLDIGLHVVLTAPAQPVGGGRDNSLCPRGRFSTLSALLCRCLFRRVSTRDAGEEIAAQVRRFEALCGFAPDFIDGHLHVHQFPGIREGLLAVVGQPSGGPAPYVRNTRESTGVILRRGVAPLKSWLLGLWGKTLARELARRSIPTNRGFGGICDYRRWSGYPRALQRFLRHARHPNYLIMAHPGLQEAWRLAEYNGLRQARFSAGQPARFVRPDCPCPRPPVR